MLETQPLVSIVTPVWNGEEYLKECIESVLRQTHENWEYLIVDNCSTDRSGEIADAYARLDGRIRAYHNQKFLEVAEANFNNALRKISPHSQYCKILPADDWIFPDCIMRMVEVARVNPTVGIVGAYSLFGNKVAWDGLPYDAGVISGRTIAREHLLGKLFVFGSPTSILLRSDLVRACDPFYSESNPHADTEKCYELLRTCDMGFVHQVLSYTRPPRRDSLRSYSDRLNTHAPARILDLLRFGRFYLDTHELRGMLAKRTLRYLAYLAKNIIRLREHDWWCYHARKVEELRAQQCPFVRNRPVFNIIHTVLRLGSRRSAGAKERLPQAA
jgi:glycosyltransferase involved in cell wall biosynthesis